MNRALPLFAAVVLVGGGLAYFATQTGPSAQRPGGGEDASAAGLDIQPPARPERKPQVATDSGAATLAAVGDSPQPGGANVNAGVGGFAKIWEIIPMNAVGQRVDGAKITAVPGEEISGVAETLSGEGRLRFENVPAGPWELTVTAEDCPTWNRIVMVPAVRRHPTAVRLGDEIRVIGQVQDTNGAPIKEPVYFLGEGASHPRKRDMSVKTPADLAASGQYLASPSGKGRFQTVLPEAGKYRVSVGHPGKARWTEPKSTELTHGGWDQILVTVPSKAELTATFSDNPTQRPTQASVYYFDSNAAARQLENRARDNAQKMELKSLADAQREAKEEAIRQKEAGLKGDANGKGGAGSSSAKTRINDARRAARGNGRGGTARTMQEENERILREGFKEDSDVTAAGRTPLFEPGWRNLRSLGIPTEGELVISDLPADKDLRFLFVRRNERITTQAPVRLRDGKRMMAEFTLPPPTQLAGMQTSNLATAAVSPRVPKEGEVVLAPGTDWSFATR